MYDFVDKRIVSLWRGGQFLVWSMRAWATALNEGKCPVPAIAPGFAKSNMVSALRPFHMAMIILHKDGQHTFCFAPMHSGCISEHEAIMLSYFRAFRNSTPDIVRATAEMLVTQEAVHPFMLATTRIATLLAAHEMIPEDPDIAFSSTRVEE